LVCIAHFYQVDELSLYTDNKLFGIITFNISQLGLKGVELFFILSGYLITRILLNTKNSPNYFKSFYIRRIFRIFPLYYFVLFLSFFVLPSVITIDFDAQQIIDAQWKLWTYTSNVVFIAPVSWDVSSFPHFGHFWSLSVEEHFYMVWPFLVYYFVNSKLIKIMWSILLFSMLSWGLGLFEPIFNWSTLKFSGALAIGGIMAHYELYNFEILKSLYFRTKKYLVIFVLLFLLTTLLPRSFDFIGVFVSYLASLILFSSLVLMAIFGNKKFKNIFNHRILFFFGKISYGLYVYHGLLRPYFKDYLYTPMYDLFGGGILISIVYTIVATLVSLLLAYLSWELFEKHILKLKKYYNY
jgi:peptidoglycan/LPS O-acetylase OafA/YrhL